MKHCSVDGVLVHTMKRSLNVLGVESCDKSLLKLKKNQHEIPDPNIINHELLQLNMAYHNNLHDYLHEIIPTRWKSMNYYS